MNCKLFFLSVSFVNLFWWHLYSIFFCCSFTKHNWIDYLKNCAMHQIHKSETNNSFVCVLVCCRDHLLDLKSSKFEFSEAVLKLQKEKKPTSQVVTGINIFIIFTNWKPTHTINFIGNDKSVLNFGEKRKITQIFMKLITQWWWHTISVLVSKLRH